MQTFIFKSFIITALIAWGNTFPPYAQAGVKLIAEKTKRVVLSTIYSVGKYDIEKSKKISKVYKVTANDKLDIDNKFGKVHINTWDKNEISVEVVMIARSNSEERAQKLLDKMDVKINQSGDAIAFKTDLESTNGKGKQSFEINYTVSMPKGNPLRLKNSFGNAYLADYTGKADLNVGYGSLKADHLSGSENTVKISFGSGNLSSMKGGKLDISYSDLKLGSSEVLDLKNDFSDIEIEQVKDLTIRSKYGDVKLGAVTSLQGSSSFSGFQIKELGNKLDMKIQYCGDFQIDKISKSFKSITVDGQFSSFDLKFENNAAFTVDVAVAFGNFRMDEDLLEEGPQFSLIEKKNTSSHHIGKVGKATTGQVHVKAQYGDVKIKKAS